MRKQRTNHFHVEVFFLCCLTFLLFHSLSNFIYILTDKTDDNLVTQYFMVRYFIKSFGVINKTHIRIFLFCSFCYRSEYNYTIPCFKVFKEPALFLSYLGANTAARLTRQHLDKFCHKVLYVYCPT